MLERDDDLLIPPQVLEQENKQKQESESSTVAFLKERGALDADIQAAREIANELDLSKPGKDGFTNSLVYRAYYAAKKSKTAAPGYIAKVLGISTKLLKFYCEKYPKFAMAIQAGYMDAVDNMKERLVDKLYEAAMGTTLTNSTETTNYLINEDGVPIPTDKTESTHTVQVAPNVSAQLELLKRLDPSWIPKVGVDISGEIKHTYNYTQDVNIQVDYKKLSPEVLHQLLEAGKTQAGVQNGMLLTESSAMELEEDTVQERPEQQDELPHELPQPQVEDKPKKRRGRPPKQKRDEPKVDEPLGSSNYGKKYRAILASTEKQIVQAKKQINLEETENNGNKTSNRGRKKKDSGKY